MHVVEHPNRTSPLNREVSDLMFNSILGRDRSSAEGGPNAQCPVPDARSCIDLSPRKAAPRIPNTLDEIDVGRIPTYGHSDCPQIVAATYGGKTRHAIVIVADSARRLICVVPQNRIVNNGRTLREWFGDPITLDDMRVTPLPMNELHPQLRSQAMTWLAEQRERVANDCRDFLDALDQDNALGPLSTSASSGCSGCDELADHEPLSFSASQHAA